MVIQEEVDYFFDLLEEESKLAEELTIALGEEISIEIDLEIIEDLRNLGYIYEENQEQIAWINDGF
jgi:hypothetical protein